MIRSNWLLVAIMGLVLAAGAAGCGRRGGEGEIATLDIRGSDTMVNLGAALAEGYMARHDSVDLVVQGGGSGTGIAALLNRNADIAQSSRPMSGSEWDEAERLGIHVEEIIVGYDAIVVCVHPGNPVGELTIAQLGSIYRGEISNWSQCGGRDESIVLLSRDTTSGTFAVFRDLVVREGGVYPEAEYGEDAMMSPSTQFIVDETRRNPQAIGYVGLGYLDHTLKALKIVVDGSDIPVTPGEPHPEGIAYPLSRPLFFYVAGQRTDTITSYLDFVLGAEGQAIVRQLHFLPR